MSIEEYKASGYLISTHISQAVIDRAERDVVSAYISIIDAAGVVSEDDKRPAMMELAYTLALQRSIFATRSGAKEKTTPQSYTADRWALLSQQSATAAMRLKQLADKAGAKDWESKVYDICGLLYKTQYIGG